MNIVDCSDERLVQMEASIEGKLEVLDEAGGVITGEVVEHSTDFTEAREKMGKHLGVALTWIFSFFSKKLEITEEQAGDLGNSWGAVAGKWYPQSLLERSVSAGDNASAFAPEITAIKTTADVFGERIISKFKEKSKDENEGKSAKFTERNQEKQENLKTDNSLKNEENSINFPQTMGII